MKKSTLIASILAATLLMPGAARAYEITEIAGKPFDGVRYSRLTCGNPVACHVRVGNNPEAITFKAREEITAPFGCVFVLAPGAVMVCDTYRPGSDVTVTINIFPR